MLTLLALAAALAQAPDPLDTYNVRWDSPTPAEQGAAGSMPIGNGEVGLNVWVEEDGDLLFYIARTDAWSECDRLLKLGRVRVSLSPNPFVKGAPFRQELVLREGRIGIGAGGPGDAVEISVFVDAFAPEIRVEGTSEVPVTVSATLENWRREKRTLSNPAEQVSSWTMKGAPPEVVEQIWESADVVRERDGGILWHHRNGHSVVPLTLRHQGLDSIAGEFADTLLHRTFGGWMSGAGFVPTAGRTGVLTSRDPVREFSLRIVTHAAQTQTLEAWETRVLSGGTGAEDAGPRTAAWWGEFWDRSWIFVEGDKATASGVPANKHPLRIGADSDGANVFRGFVSWPAVYGTALTAEQVKRASTWDPVADPAAGDPEPVAAWAHAPMENGAIPERVGGVPLTAIGEASRGLWSSDGAALELKGGYFEVPAAGAPELSHGLTLAASILPEALTPARIFDKMTAGGSDGFIFDTHPGDSLRLIVGRMTISAPHVLKAGVWQHVAATFDPATGRAALYLDGTLVKESGRIDTSTPPPSRVTQAYVLQRWVSACGSRPGKDSARVWPVKFNGSIFTVEPAPTEGQAFTADWRKWGGCFWWQNTRLPYYPMLAAGDFDLMDPLFRYYEENLAGCSARTRAYYGAEGVYFPETMTSFGTYANGDYGWSREGLTAGDISPCPWWQWAWNQSLELTQLMLDYAAYTGDERFLVERALPMARETLRYFDSRFARDGAGQLVISPTQAVETYWQDVVNDSPCVGGLHAVCDLLLALPAGVGSAEERALWKRMKDACPPLPVVVVDGVSVPSPARAYKDKRSNVEAPELYPLWPFRQYGLGKPGLEGARIAYAKRVNPSTVGWTQDGMFAAMLGLTEEAEQNLLAKVRNTHRNFRFPVMWGPNFDWLPDQCHGGNVMSGLQLMLMQCDGRTIRLLPAWPADWNASFKLHAPEKTVVEGRVEGGKLVELKVTPEARRGDVVVGK